MGGVFINYRREDSGHMAGRLRDSLASAFGHDQIFMDVDDIPVGIDFKAHLNSQLAECDVILVVIGSKWLKVKEARQRRLDQPEDPVAIEIAAALDRQIPVIPVLIDGTRIPNERDLPNALKPLAERQAVEVRHPSFRRDVDSLIARMCEAVPALLDRIEAPQTDNAPTVKHRVASVWATSVQKGFSYLDTRELGCLWLVIFAFTLTLCGVGVVTLGGDIPVKFPSGFSLQQAGPVALKVIKALPPQKFKGLPRVLGRLR
jgi:hypothetical protein